MLAPSANDTCAPMPTLPPTSAIWKLTSTVCSVEVVRLGASAAAALVVFDAAAFGSESTTLEVLLGAIADAVGQRASQESERCARVVRLCDQSKFQACMEKNIIHASWQCEL